MIGPMIRRGGLGVLAVLVALPFLSGSAGAAAQVQVPRDVVYGAGASGALLGVTLRIPATSAGGLGYAESSINLSTARARSAAFYPGFLVDAFFKSSCNCAYNPTDTIAQNPPSSSAPEKSSFRGSQATPAGEQLTLVAETPSLVEASSRLVAGELRAPSAPIVIDGGRVQTSAKVQPDGTVITTVAVTTTGIEIARTVLISQATSLATTTTAPGKVPVMAVATRVGTVLVNGIRAELSEKGLVIANNSVVTAEQIATFNSALKGLEAQGIFVSAVKPIVENSRPGFGEVLTGALRIRYQVKQNPTPNDVGTDTEFLVASVGNLASAQRRVTPRPGGFGDPPVDLELPPSPGLVDGSAGAASGSSGETADSLAFEDTTAPTAASGQATPLVPEVAGSTDEAVTAARPTSLLDLLANSKKGGVAPKLVSLYGWLLAVTLLVAALPARIVARRRTA